MLEEIRKGLLTGFGAVLITREKAEEATQKLVEEAKLSREEAQHLVDELFAIGTRQWSEMEASFSDAIRKGIENLDIASKKELHELKARLGKVEKRLATLEQQSSTKKES
jgi:polyhydroxyalkanoate synthesis regulator phasin